jgi:CheY-like chemotaxis protein
MKKDKFVVLVVEDNTLAQMNARHVLSPYAEVLSALCLRDAIRLLRERDDIDYAILDWSVPAFLGETPRVNDTTECIVWEIRNLSHGDIVMYSASSDDVCNQRLVQMGCVKSTKETAPQMVLDSITHRQ